MSRYRADSETQEPPKRNRCSRVLYYTWKVITCIFSHITLLCLVVLYCILGAWAFARLEADNERLVKQSIKAKRHVVIDYIWTVTREMDYLEETNWTRVVKEKLQEFEGDLLLAMTKDGWDGIEDTETIQWTFAGALFYSIIVITTIGYGHIAPKTQWGKVVTIFYAILGIPLMLLCLSNIGDIMATSFRFLYWKVCCYVCTKKPKKHRRRNARSTIRTQGRYSNRSRTASFRRSGRTSQRSADSGFGLSEISPVSYSDTELRYHDDTGLPPVSHHRGSSLPRMRPSQLSHTSTTTRYSDTAATTSGRPSPSRLQHPRGGSLDRRRAQPPPLRIAEPGAELDFVIGGADAMDKTPVLCNKYVIDVLDGEHLVHANNNRRMSAQMSPGRRAISMPRQQNYLEPPSAKPPSPEPSIDTMKRSARRRPQSPNPSPSIMSPMGFTVHRQKYFDEQDSDTDYYEDGYYPEGGRSRIKPVPIWLCVFLVVSYIFGGAFLFTAWENWEYLDSAYFCFITLTTIGFGDFVPAKRVQVNAEVSIALCSLYLLFGISLLAMSFNLVQEEVIANVKSVAKTLGIIKSETEDEEEED